MFDNYRGLIKKCQCANTENVKQSSPIENGTTFRYNHRRYVDIVYLPRIRALIGDRFKHPSFPHAYKQARDQTQNEVRTQKSSEPRSRYDSELGTLFSVWAYKIIKFSVSCNCIKACDWLVKAQESTHLPNTCFIFICNFSTLFQPLQVETALHVDLRWLYYYKCDSLCKFPTHETIFVLFSRHPGIKYMQDM